MIKKIQAESGAKVQFQQGREDGPGDRKCLLSGKHQAVEQARQRIQELIDSVMVCILIYEPIRTHICPQDNSVINIFYLFLTIENLSLTSLFLEKRWW